MKFKWIRQHVRADVLVPLSVYGYPQNPRRDKSRNYRIKSIFDD